MPGCHVQLGNAVQWSPMDNAELWGWKHADPPYGGRDLLINSCKACLLGLLGMLHGSLTSLKKGRVKSGICTCENSTLATWLSPSKEFKTRCKVHFLASCLLVLLLKRVAEGCCPPSLIRGTPVSRQHPVQHKVSFQQPGWLVTKLSDSYLVATAIATEQEVAIKLHHLIKQLSDAGNEPFDFLYSMEGDFSPHPPPRDF